ncbi:ABC-2 type transport system permease protein [Gracilibacillus halotolerans]|uniref:ABC-2 type transport system permease protein n=1 Tax=Gracilibacillus halotolerans TaxID=74386 RepID=A0A841RQF0_9BACI|nr:ABC transporter permease [Gracilibacillus halotolerans]MBB6513144.1 ABC-2 type transport system permease protein [Gracilibacillus halotolerans]
MHNFIALLQNENMKLSQRISTWIMYAILLVIILFGAVIEFFSESVTTTEVDDNWKEELRVETANLEEMNEEDEYMYGMFTDEIAINNYHIENDIKPLPYDAWQFTMENAGLSSMISLFTIIIAAGIIASEYRLGTIKLLLIRPISRTKILLSKYVTVLLFSMIMLLFLFISSMIIGSLFFGLNGLNPTIVQMSVDGPKETSIFGEIFTQYGLNMINLVMMATFAFMISSLFRNSGMAIGTSIFLMFTGTTVVAMLSNYEWAKYILFANTNLNQYMGNGVPVIEGMTLGFSIAIIAIYYIIFLVVSWLAFTKRDVAGA